MDFTLENLVGMLESAGYKVTSSGPDNRPELADFRSAQGGISGVLDHCENTRSELVDKLPAPLFFAVIEENGDLLKVTTKLMERVWEKFTRGLMEFNGEVVEGKKVRVVITQRKQDGTAPAT